MTEATKKRAGEGPDALLVLNAGSSSLKFAVYRPDASGRPGPQYRGLVDEIGRDSRLRVFLAPESSGQVDREVQAGDHEHALHLALGFLEERHPALDFRAAGHRVVHGGAAYARPVRVDEKVLADLEALVPVSPLHQPHNLAAIRALKRLRPALTQVACFDTAFHRSMPELAQRFALPRAWLEQGIRRYGFHGLSYEYIAGVLPEHLGRGADGKVVVAHLGNGASLCAMEGRRSRETTMSFTPLDGIPMGTRCGALDPGVLLYLMRERGLGLDELDDLLRHRSGLLGLSGVSFDVRELLASADPHAAEALELFTYRVAMGIGGLATALGGLDALVFTAGIGEHAAPVRAAICRRLAWLGLELDEAANTVHGARITLPASRVSAWVIPTDEEAVIARHAWELAGGAEEVR
jgi:acetate kinase